MDSRLAHLPRPPHRRHGDRRHPDAAGDFHRGIGPYSDSGGGGRLPPGDGHRPAGLRPWGRAVHRQLELLGRRLPNVGAMGRGAGHG